MKERNTYIIIIAFLVFMVVFITWRGNVRENNMVDQIVTSSDIAKEYSLKSGAIVASNTALVASTQTQMESFAKSLNDTIYKIVKKFKSVQNITYATSNFYTSKDTIRTVNIPCDFKPFKVRRSDSTYNFTGTIAKDYFSVDSLYVPNKVSIVSGRKKTGFMKHDYTVDINNSNPLIRTSNISAYQYAPQKKWYERTWVHMLAGAAIYSGVQTTLTYTLKR
jgi:hypothetical protein